VMVRFGVCFFPEKWSEVEVEGRRRGDDCGTGIEGFWVTGDGGGLNLFRSDACLFTCLWSDVWRLGW